MRLRYTETFLKAFADAPPRVRSAFSKQADFLLRDIRHPSLRAKKYDEANGIWQARATRSWRFYFRIEDNTYLLTGIVPHPK